MTGKFKYPRHPPGANLLKHRHGFAIAIAAAYDRGDVEPVCAILEDENRNLSMRDRLHLTRFLRRDVPHTSKTGKRPGAVPMTAEDAENLILEGVRTQLAQERQLSGKKRSRNGRKDQLVDEHHKRLLLEYLHPLAERVDVEALKDRVYVKRKKK